MDIFRSVRMYYRYSFMEVQTIKMLISIFSNNILQYF